MNYTLHQLEIFKKVAELKSVTKASEQLFLSQPAVSIQLKNFQDQFKIPLFEIVGRKLYVTEFGEEIKSAVSNTQNIIFTLGGNGSDKASFLAKDVLENAPESAKITWILAPPAVQPTKSNKYVNTGKPDREVNTYKATRAKYNKEITAGIKAVEAKLPDLSQGYFGRIPNAFASKLS